MLVSPMDPTHNLMEQENVEEEGDMNIVEEDLGVIGDIGGAIGMDGVSLSWDLDKEGNGYLQKASRSESQKWPAEPRQILETSGHLCVQPLKTMS